MQYFDVVIIGAGAVGASLGVVLATAGKKVMLVEKKSPLTQTQTDLMAPTLALSYGTRFFLQRFGLDACLANAERIDSVKVSRAGGLAHPLLTAKEQGKDCLGVVVGALDLIESLHNRLKHLKVPVAYASQVKEATLAQNSWQLKIEEQNQTLQTKLVVCADGADSQLAKQVGITWQTAQDDHYGVITNIRMSKPHAGCAHERFGPFGTFALLPWRSNCMTNVWSVCQRDAEQLLEQDKAAYIAACYAQCKQLTGSMMEVGKRRMVPLQSALSRTQIGPRILLMGNAAHLIHPIAAQGFNLSVKDIMAFNQVMKSAHTDDLGSIDFLQQYANERQSEQNQTMGLTALLSKYVAANRIPGFMQSMGLALFDTLPGVRKQFTRLAMGG